MTNKKAIENLKEDFYQRFPDDWGQELWVKIEKDLEALEIIKLREIDVKDITDTTDDFELYQAYCIGKGYDDEYICTKEEFNLLKEVLKDDK